MLLLSFMHGKLGLVFKAPFHQQILVIKYFDMPILLLILFIKW